MERHVFVARQQELANLDRFLNQTLNSQGTTCFVTGEAGTGKTSLTNEFARRALEKHDQLVVAYGQSDSQTGVGDAYLPFRELLAQLTGDVETKMAQGSITPENANRLRKLLALSVQAMLEVGPDLIGLFVPAGGLITRVGAFTVDKAGWTNKLEQLSDRSQTRKGDLSTGIEQSHIYEQYTNVLKKISEKQPLLLVLDDLQWADAASIGLLFRLGRRIGSSRIMIVGTYRPEEVAIGRAGERHPMEKVLAEFKRYYGDIFVDLDRAERDESRYFVDAFLDTETNLFGEGFRQALVNQTGGHPLFTTELLRDMQERGDLIQDERGRWMESPLLDWSELPSRVEGVIEERIGRLEEELCDILSIASVEGEDFTAQVIAHVQEIRERQLLRRLSGELEKHHRLIHARGEQVIGEHTLSKYRFTHALFQQFLYNDLSPGERRLLHKEIAQVLEQLYAGNLDEIFLQLAHHYSQANEGEKAIPYLLMVGDHARNIYAHQEAIDFYQRALSFQEKLGDYDGAARTQMKLGQTYHSDFDYKRANESYEQGFRLWQRSSEIQSAVTKPPSPDPLRLVLDEDPLTLDPGLSNNIYSRKVISHLFSGLLEYTPEMDVLPDIAKRWKILEGGRRYVFHLREDILWSDGTAVTAEDFVYAWRRVLNPANQSGSEELLYDIKGAREFHQGETSDTESLGIRANGQYTLEVELDEPAGYFLQLMAHTVAFPIPRHVVERLGENWTEVGNIVVNGPFLIEKRDSGVLMNLVRNPIYRGRFSGNVQRVRINFHYFPEWEIQLAMYEADDLDMMFISYFPPEEMNRLRRQHSGDYISAPYLNVYYLVFNTVRAPFDDPRIRRAFMMAADKQTGVAAASGGALIPPMGGLIPPGIPGHSPGIGLPYDPVGAQELMTQAGYPNGRGFPVVEVQIEPGYEEYLEGVRQSWREALGVNLTWNIVPSEERTGSEPFHMSFCWWVADYPDPDNFLRMGFRKEITDWPGETFDELVTNARRMLDQAERLKLYQEADRILIEEAVVLPIFYDMIHLLIKPWIKRFPISPIQEWFLKDVVIEPH